MEMSMRSLSANEEAALRCIAERHGYLAARGPHARKGSASRLMDALLAGDVVTLALTPADRERLVRWLTAAPVEGRLATILRTMTAQLQSATPPVPAARSIAPRLVAPPAVAPIPRPARVHPLEEPTTTLQVELWLRVENTNTFVRGKTKARAAIEDGVLRPYSMQKPHDSGYDYVLTIPYRTAEDLDGTIYEILDQAAREADFHHCFIESDVRALDGSDRQWQPAYGSAT
jgi:hypothetical protein